MSRPSLPSLRGGMNAFMALSDGSPGRYSVSPLLARLVRHPLNRGNVLEGPLRDRIADGGNPGCQGQVATHCGRSSQARRGVAAVSPRMSAAGRASLPSMSKMQSEVIATFTLGEWDYIRRQLNKFFSTLSTVADGFQLKTWRGGPEGGQAEAAANCQGAGGARPHAARYRRTPATAVLHRDGPSDATRDDGGPPFCRPGKIRPCSPRTRHRPRLGGGPARGMMTRQGARAPRTDRKPDAAWPPDACGTDITTPFAAVLRRAVLPCCRRDTRVLVRNSRLSGFPKVRP